MTALCAGRDPEFWTPGHEQARLAMRICSLCVGCPDNDPTPAGVIRQGVPYADTGSRIPLCPNCARPHTGYLGGEVTLCRMCAVPDVPVPDVRALRNARIAGMARRGVADEVIAAEVGMEPLSVAKIRRRSGIRYRRASAAVPAGSRAA